MSSSGHGIFFHFKRNFNISEVNLKKDLTVHVIVNFNQKHHQVFSKELTLNE